jgi:hypothetical protein
MRSQAFDACPNIPVRISDRREVVVLFVDLRLAMLPVGLCSDEHALSGNTLTPTHHVQWIRVNGCQCIRGRQRRLDEAGDKTPIAAGFLR